MKPKILLTCEDGFSGDTGHFVASRAYGDAVAMAGGLPFVAFDVKSVEEYADFADGLFLTGGQDMHCYRYGEVYRTREEMTPSSRTRDDLDFALCNAFLKRKKPIFGVGRGLEVLNVALGGTLYKDILQETGKKHPTEDAPTGGYDGVTKASVTYHPITVNTDTRLGKVLAAGKTTVNSCHHQAIKLLAEGMTVVAAAPDGIIEAAEHEILPVFGVMWHPERSADMAENLLPLQLLIRLCREKEEA